MRSIEVGERKKIFDFESLGFPTVKMTQFIEMAGCITREGFERTASGLKGKEQTRLQCLLQETE
jgi:hypothetical protein